MEKIRDTIEQIEKYLQTVFGTGDVEFRDLATLTSNVHTIYQEFLDLVPRLNEIGMDIQPDILLQQMKNLASAMKRKDAVLLYDTLTYEVKDTLSFYLEIKEIMEQE